MSEENTYNISNYRFSDIETWGGGSEGDYRTASIVSWGISANVFLFGVNLIQSSVEAKKKLDDEKAKEAAKSLKL